MLISASLCKRDWLETAALAIDGGADCLQLREKSLDDGELLARARAMSALCRRRNVLFIVNDRPDIVVLADADGVHLGQADMSPADARRILGPDRLIGLSTHNPDQLHAALSGTASQGGPPGIDYLAVGPMFASSTKPQDHVPGPDLLTLATPRQACPSSRSAASLRPTSKRFLPLAHSVCASARPSFRQRTPAAAGFLLSALPTLDPQEV